MYVPDKDGIVAYEQLKYLEETHGIHDSKLDAMIPPEESQYVFNLYWEKFRGTEVSYKEIKAFQDLTGIVLDVWEIDLLFSIHNVVEGHITEMFKKNTK